MIWIIVFCLIGLFVLVIVDFVVRILFCNFCWLGWWTIVVNLLDCSRLFVGLCCLGLITLVSWSLDVFWILLFVDDFVELVCCVTVVDGCGYLLVGLIDCLCVDLLGYNLIVLFDLFVVVVLLDLYCLCFIRAGLYC